MLSGNKPLPAATAAGADSAATRTAALLLALACGAIAAWIASLAS